MFKKIMIPVDLRHTPSMGKALNIAAELAKSNNATVTYVGVTSPEPGELGHNPAEYSEKLKQFAAAQADAHGHSAQTHMIVANDPAIDLDSQLTQAAEETGADLVVMATHIPNVTDYVWSSHGGYLANHARASVFLVRG
ncbi:Universal stress protein F [Hartmannibacter diazotrophicus]|uniref:Universal stress protein F n=2 Tax=Hartmannibacter diazotrophicus TaxID=1482074 RepID=A0A2C9D595_9HYPH|nr:Universal stress protein F [Hartmannibacter diazotrophicus]